MARTKELLHSAWFQESPGRRKCRRNRTHTINPGYRCFVIKDGLNEKSYCLACAKVILQRGKKQLETLLAEL